MIKSYTYKIFIAQLGTLNNLQNTQVRPPPFPLCVPALYPTAHLYFFAVTVWHLGAAWSQSQSSADIRHILDAPSSPAISAMVIGCLCVPSNHREPELWAEHKREFTLLFLYFVISRAFNAAQTQILPCQNTNTSWGLNENVVAECERQQKTLPHFFPCCRFPLRPLASLRHNVWQTHRFVALKTAFQRVTINNSLMTNSADIYTWLGVFLRRAGGQ